MLFRIPSGAAIACASAALGAFLFERAPAQQLEFRELHRMLPGPAEDEASPIYVPGDFDGDGTRDLVAVRRSPSRPMAPVLLSNDGSGYFREAQSFPTPIDPYFEGNASAGDVDGDGDLDLLAVSWSGNRLFVNDGTGRFADVSASWLPPQAEVAGSIALGDIDADGDLDALFGNRFASRTNGVPTRSRLYRNDDGARFVELPSSIFAPSLADTRAVKLADFDGDGDLDVFAASYGGQSRVYLNSLPAAFTEAPNFPGTSRYTVDAVVGDIDGDLDLDIVCANETAIAAERYTVLQNDGRAGFMEAPGLIPPVSTPCCMPQVALAMLDLDGDRDLDLYVSEAGGDRALRNTGGGVYADDPAMGARPPRLNSASSIVASDCDADGDLDLLLSDRWDGFSCWLRNDGRGVLENATHMPFGLEARYSTALALGDVDGDGFIDAVVAQYFTREIAVHRNDRTGNFHRVAAVATQPHAIAANDLVLADVDRDGDLDLFCANNSSGGPPAVQPQLFLNDGLGGFSEVTATHLPIDPFLATRAAFGDLDSDGDPDLVIAAAQDYLGLGGQNRIFWNDGSGRFANGTAAAFPTENYDTRDLVLADLDGDRDLDVVFANHSQVIASRLWPVADSVYLNRGNRTFALASHLLSTNLEYSTSLDAGDLDADGDVDLVVGTDPMGHFLYWNDGSGRLTRANGAVPQHQGRRTSDLAIVDLDADGQLDLALMWADAPSRLCRRTAAAPPTFVELPAGTWPSIYSMNRAAFADLDLDGDVDAVTTSYDRVLTNLTRQLAWRALPRIGRALQLDVYRSAGMPWVLCASTASAAISCPPFGTLRLDPAGLQSMASGIASSSGRDAASFVVPRDPALVGRSIAWQALFGSAPVLSNLELTIFAR